MNAIQKKRFSLIALVVILTLVVPWAGWRTYGADADDIVTVSGDQCKQRTTSSRDRG